MSSSRHALSFFVLGLGIAGCQSGKPASPVAPPSSLQTLEKAYLDENFDFDPQSAAAAGLHAYDEKVGNFTLAAVEQHRKDLVNLREQVAAHLVALPPGPERANAEILSTAISSSLLSIDLFDAYRHNPMTYAIGQDVNLFVKRDYEPKPARLAKAVAVLLKIPGYMEVAEKNLDAKLPRVYITTAISNAEGQIEFLNGDLQTAFEDVPDTAAKDRLKTVAAKAAESIKKYVTFLKEERLPKATDDFAIGRDAFVKMLRTTELIEETPEQILEIGLKELKHQQEVFDATAKEIDPTRPAIDVWKDVQKEHPTAEGLLPDTRKHLDEIHQFLVDRDLITLPTDQRVLVEETPKYARATSFASMDTPGIFETKATESFYYVTPTEPEWDQKHKDEWLTAFNYYTTDVVSIHEAYPGHFMQALHLKASKLPDAIKYAGSYAFIEGWAHYSEQMILDEGFPPKPLLRDAKSVAKYRFAQADEALLRCCRLVVAIKMHCQGMTLDEGTKFFQDNCHYEPAPARSEAERGSYDPGYCLYTVGKLQILKLREDWKRQEGSAFTLKRFHDELLKHGQPPVRVLRELMLKDSALWAHSL